jgi:ribosome assembly protein 1
MTASLIDEEISNQLKNQVTPKEFINSINMGFELAVASGPLCEESMYGVIFIIEEIKFSKGENKTSDDKEKEKAISEEKQINDSKENSPMKNKEINIEENTEGKDLNLFDKEVNTLIENMSPSLKEENKSEDQSDLSKKLGTFGPFLGQIIGTVKDCCRKAFLNGEPRLYEAIYLCLFQIKQEHVGKIHSVVSKRRGTIINELSNDESIVITIEAVVPVVESFGFVEEIRKNTSGMANPMLQFYKWEVIDVDPFYIPMTQEVLDNFGTNIDAPNLAKNYINKIRLRKGLPTDEKIIKGADKQKNLSKKR